DIGRTVFAGVAAGATRVDLRLDGAGLRVEKLSVADFGGAAIDASGAIDLAASPPRGSLALSVDAPRLDGLTALAQRYAPDWAPALVRHAEAFAPAKVEGTLRIDPAPKADEPTARLTLAGSLGAL